MAILFYRVGGPRVLPGWEWSEGGRLSGDHVVEYLLTLLSSELPEDSRTL